MLISLFVIVTIRLICNFYFFGKRSVNGRTVLSIDLFKIFFFFVTTWSFQCCSHAQLYTLDFVYIIHFKSTCSCEYEVLLFSLLAPLVLSFFTVV